MAEKPKDNLVAVIGRRQYYAIWNDADGGHFGEPHRRYRTFPRCLIEFPDIVFMADSIAEARAKINATNEAGKGLPREEWGPVAFTKLY